jgi:two-component system cell cycle response regulator CtrA
MSMKILVVSQSGESTSRTINGLQADGFVINHYRPGQDSPAAIRSDDGLAMLIGPDLRGADPRALIRSLRSAGDDRPMLVIASDSLYSQRVALLNTGADDVFSFPCDTQEVAARIRAVVRRARGLAKAEIQVGEITLDLNARCAYVHDNKIQLTSKEYQIIELLAINRGKVMSKDTIMNHLYDYDAVPDQKIIDVFVCKIRRKLQEANAPETISTVWGQGYIIRDERIPAAKQRQIQRVALHGETALA